MGIIWLDPILRPLEGVHSLCSPSVTVFAEFQQSFARVLAEFYFQLFSGEAVFAPGIPRNKSLDAVGFSMAESWMR